MAPTQPPSFPLTLITAYEEGTENEGGEEVPHLIQLEQDKYPPVSPGMAETILTLNSLLTIDPAISATIRATALGLVSTIHM